MQNIQQNKQMILLKPHRIDLEAISDSVLEQEYVKRFTISAGEIINSSEDVILHLRPYFCDDPHREKFVCIYLNGRNQMLATETLFVGSLTTSAVYPREVIKRILHHGAAAAIFAHPHPSGNPEPSQDDIAINNKLIAACKTIDVAVHDHIIIAGTGFTSLADRGLM